MGWKVGCGGALLLVTEMDIRTVTFSCNYLYIDYYDLLMLFCEDSYALFL
jgi:hypothetical protein